MNEMINNFSNRFQRSIRIDTDFNDLGIVDTFVSSETADKTIIDMCHQIKNGNKHLPGLAHMDLESQVLLLFFMELFPIKIINFIKKYGSYQ